MSEKTSKNKLILVIGATGAQGLAVIDGLLKPAVDESPSPYTVRALTRDPNSSRAKALSQRPGVEVFKGSTDDFPRILEALRGCWGAFVNTDSFTIGEEKEVYTGIRIFELAKQVGTLRHYVWSGLDYTYKETGFNPLYRCVHHDGKGRVSDWMRSQPSVVGDDSMSWSILTTMAYMEMIQTYMYGPLNKRADGTYVFAAPIGNGHVPMIALTDVGFFARYLFDNHEATSAQELRVAGDRVDWPYLVSTFTKVTGQPAVYLPLSMDDWFALFNQDDINKPLANEKQIPDGSTTWRENFTCWWAQYRDDIIKRDFDMLRRINPNLYTLERWMREAEYNGNRKRDLLKNALDGKVPRLDVERCKGL
ncbi:NAD-P-binding protein [Trametes meyenii]|nr:NAD-P-binding protein [Trametes meyenii]